MSDAKKAVKQLESELGPMNAIYDNVDANNWQNVVLDSYKDILVDDEFIIRCARTNGEISKQKNETYKTDILVDARLGVWDGRTPNNTFVFTVSEKTHKKRTMRWLILVVERVFLRLEL